MSAICNQLKNVGFIEFNRPKALNSANLEMVQTTFKQLSQWDPMSSPVKCYFVKGAGDKAYCAGGDVKLAVQQLLEGNFNEPRLFFNYEYRNNYLLSKLQKPYVAWLNGITMGGGVGLSIHGHFQVATERTMFAMPEVGIGLFPDVGASYFLNKLPYNVGKMMGLTGVPIRGYQVKAAGLATHFIAQEKQELALNKLIELGDKALDKQEVDQMLKSIENENEIDKLNKDLIKAEFQRIDEIFRSDSLEEIVEKLQAEKFERNTLIQLAQDAIVNKKVSPLSQRIFWQQYQTGKEMSLKQALQMEFLIVQNMLLKKEDFITGVTSKLINKDQNPKWKYSSIQEVPQEEVLSYFQKDSKQMELLYLDDIDKQDNSKL